MTKDTIKVYWAPFPFSDKEAQWNMSYRPPVAVADNFYSNLRDEARIVRCPVTRESMKNLFSFNSNINDEIELSPDLIKIIYEDKSQNEYELPVESKISLIRARPTSYEGFINFSYNVSWVLLAEEPVMMKMGPPTFPVVMPSENSLLAFGKYDVGRWFRPINLDYHVPIDAIKFSVKEGQPLVFLEFETDKKIELVRFKNTEYLKNLANEFSESPLRWGKRISLEKRYKMAYKSGIIDLALSEIKKNIVD